MPMRGVLCGLVAALLLAAPVFAASLDDLNAATARRDWQSAETIAAALDRADAQGDFYAGFVRAQELIDRNDCTDAVVLLGALTLARPLFLPAHELAYLCHRFAGDHKRAAAELDRMLAVLPPGAQRDLVEQLRQIEELDRGPSFDIYGDVMPTSNVERQTAATTLSGFTIAEGSRGHAGVVAKGGVAMTYRLYATSGFHLAAVIRPELQYATTGLLAPSLTLELPMTFTPQANFGIVLTPFTETGFSGTTHDLTQAGMRASASWQVTDRLSAGFSAGASWSHYALEPYRDGIDLNGAASVSYALDPQTLLSGSLNADDLYAWDATQRTLALYAVGRIDHIAQNGLVIGLQAYVGRRWHSAPPPLSSGPNQTDAFVSGRIELGSRRLSLGAFRPTLYYQYTRQWSDNVFYRYDSHDVGLTLKAQF
jgi:hypothetical protein